MKLQIERQPSSYETYRPLRYQEIYHNPKNKYDNRLYYSMRYKSGQGTLDERYNELLDRRNNHLSFWFGAV